MILASASENWNLHSFSGYCAACIGPGNKGDSDVTVKDAGMEFVAKSSERGFVREGYHKLSSG